MGNRVVVQPNGKYARFSDVVDDFTHIGLSRAAMIVEAGGEHSLTVGRAKVERAEQVPERFAEELDTIRFRHGYKVAKQRLRACGVDPRKWKKGAK